MLEVAVLDDYSGAALESAQWSRLADKARLTVLRDHLNEAEAVQALQPFDAICTLRERMALPGSLLEKLPQLKLITIIGASVPNLDLAAATRLGIVVSHSNLQHPQANFISSATPELAWGLMLSGLRNIAYEDRRMRAGEWQSTVGVTLAGRTLGLLGLGKTGSHMARYGHAFGMNVLAWSQNLTEENALAAGARRVEKDELFRRSDVVSIHVRLSDRTRGLVSAGELGLMQPHSYLINTSRGPIVVEEDLITALREGRIAGAGIDVYDDEPLPLRHPLRNLDNVTITPHLGYVTRETLAVFYSDTLESILAYATGKPIRVVNPEALRAPRQMESATGWQSP